MTGRLPALVAVAVLVLCALVGTPIARAENERTGGARGEAQEHVLKAKIYMKSNRLQDAEAELLAARRADPTWNDVLFDVGVLYDLQDRPQDAIDVFRAYLPYATAEDQTEVRERIARAQIRLDDAGRASERASAEQARAEAARRSAEAERAAQQANTTAQAARVAAESGSFPVSIRSRDGATFSKVKLKIANGTEGECAAVDVSHPCTLPGVSGTAKIKCEDAWLDQEIRLSDREADVELRVNHLNLKTTLILTGASISVVGLLGVVGGMLGGGEHPKPWVKDLVIGGGAAAVAGIVLMLSGAAVTGTDATVQPTPAAPVSASRSRRPSFAFDVSPTRGGGEVAAAIAF